MAKTEKGKASETKEMKLDKPSCVINVPGNIRFNAYASEHFRLDDYKAIKIFYDDETETVYMVLCGKRDHQAFTLSWVTSYHVAYMKGLFKTLPSFPDYYNYQMTFALIEEYNDELKRDVIRMELLKTEDRQLIDQHTSRPRPRKKAPSLEKKPDNISRRLFGFGYSPSVKTISKIKAERRALKCR